MGKEKAGRSCEGVQLMGEVREGWREGDRGMKLRETWRMFSEP
jgi:hypothetical protein